MVRDTLTPSGAAGWGAGVGSAAAAGDADDQCEGGGDDHEDPERPQQFHLDLRGEDLDAAEKLALGVVASFAVTLLMLLAVFVMYVILAILYESYVHPLTVLSTLPTARTRSAARPSSSRSPWTIRSSTPSHGCRWRGFR